ncbi:MAG: MotA/TolQ/ExbB proton channel family protein [Sphingomonas sp.]|uniref:motility protein A n=1 Tax=Sphingomonas sp. TaxID=28214 RepID=UPI0025F01C64|nr:MotA/TolQ/ExbB proton channel family protein [Sphingomonas sp.]MBQ1497770.1 MotA/TolQ/ExbB proton channel family protein [Sphingomonas sp.]
MNALPALGTFLDPLALAIVGGGTLAGTLLRSASGDLARGAAALGVLPRRRFDAEPLLAQVSALGRIARRHGVIALDRSKIEDPDIAAAVAAIVDGAGPREVETLLEQRRCARVERQRGAWEVWSGAAELAPAMGMVGTLLGLVGMFAAMKDPQAIGGAMAVALLATLYGALLANLVLLPVAVRLKRRARHEAQERLRLQPALAALAGIEPGTGRIKEIAA